MAGVNEITLIGRMGKDPESGYTPSGIAYAKFTLAVDRPTKTEEGQKITDWFDCVAWRQAAEFVTKYGSKGRLAYIKGSHQSRKWVAQDGSNRTSWDVNVDRVQILDRPPDAEGHEDHAGHAGQTSMPGMPAPPAAPRQSVAAGNGHAHAASRPSAPPIDPLAEVMDD